MKTFIRRIKAKIQARKNRRNAVRMLVYAGVLRHASHGIRYGMTEKDIQLMLREEDL